MLEFIFELVFEFFGEVILQIIFEALAEVGLHLFRSARGPRRRANPVLAAFGYVLLGGIVGAISLVIFPNSIMRTQNGRIVTLLLAPVASGLAMSILGAWRERRGQQVLGLDRFAYGYVFALAMSGVRFLWAH